MATRSTASISRSLAPLRDVVASLSAASEGALPPANDRRRLVRRVRAAGSSALPALLRALTSGLDGEARWAAWLLQRVALPERARVAERVSRMLEDPRLGPAERARAESLLDGLIDVGVELSDAIDTIGALGGDEIQLCEEITALPGPCERVERARARPTPAAGKAPIGGVGVGGNSDVDGDEDGERGSDGFRDGVRRSVRRRVVARSAARRAGFELLERGDVRRAATALRQAAAVDPDDGEVRSYLGVCLLQLGQPDEAITHLEHACVLDPDEALHHWNIAAAAKEADRMCRGYLALQRYLVLPDGFDGHAERRREARRFLASYEKLIAAMHPGVAIGDVLRGEELFLQALADLSSRRYPEAVGGFREVIALLPHHYPSWGNLGAAELGLGNLDEATRCLRHALSLKPDYDVARENLALLETRH